MPQVTQRKTKDESYMPALLAENEPRFSRWRSKTPTRFPAAQIRAAHKAALRICPSVGVQA